MKTRKAIKAYCRQLANWWWLPTNPYKYIQGLEGVEGAMNITWAIRGRPLVIQAHHLGAVLGKARDLAEEKVKGQRVGDWATQLKPAEFLAFIEKNPDVFTRYWSLQEWRQALKPINATP